MNYDLDQYFTPSKLAEDIFLKSGVAPPSVCVDSTCGEGSLLHAANTVFGEVNCVGIDKDKQVIAKLKRKNPDWLLSVADMLAPNSYKRTKAVLSTSHCDLLTLNPPFSIGNKKFETVLYKGDKLKTSVAMAYILKSLEIFKPKNGAIVVVPESVLFSEIDSGSRLALAKEYSTSVLMELDSKTFRGTRARSAVIKLSHERGAKTTTSSHTFLLDPVRIEVIRGNLPVHELIEDKSGKRFVHSTDIKLLINQGTEPIFRMTRQENKRVVSKWVMLVPRVGVFDKNSLRSIYLKDSVHLSDCVIALAFNSKNHAIEVEAKINQDRESFANLYRGTGARYITISRLQSWLLDRNIITS